MSCEATGSRLGIALFLIPFFFQCNQDEADNFEAVDLSWVKSTTDPLEVLGHSLDILEDPSKINSDNHEMWCNLHITPALRGIIVEAVPLCF